MPFAVFKNLSHLTFIKNTERYGIDFKRFTKRFLKSHFWIGNQFVKEKVGNIAGPSQDSAETKEALRYPSHRSGMTSQDSPTRGLELRDFRVNSSMSVEKSPIIALTAAGSPLRMIAKIFRC